MYTSLASWIASSGLQRSTATYVFQLVEAQGIKAQRVPVGRGRPKAIIKGEMVSILEDAAHRVRRGYRPTHAVAAAIRAMSANV